MNRREFIKAAGGIGVATIGLGVGYTAFTDRASAQAINISSNDRAITNDRGDLAKVTIDPTFRVEWSDMDTAVAKTFYVIEARTRDNGNWSDWSPIFRSTPWLTPGSLQGADASKPGTTGFIEFSDPLSAIMNRSSNARGASGEDPRGLPRAIEVANELGRPDYENADFSGIGGVTSGSYLAGSSVGSADDAYTELDNGRLSNPEGGPIESGSSSLSDNKQQLPLVNNFPGAESGYYGAADNTDRFDVDRDGTSDTDTVGLRYTFALQTLNTGGASLGDDPSNIGYTPISSFTANPLGDYDTLEQAVREDPHLENVRPSDVQQDSQGNSILVMNGEDGYPDLTDNIAGSAASNNYDGYQAIADSHPSVVVAETSFTVDVTNESATATPQGATGSSGTGATGGGQ